MPRHNILTWSVLQASVLSDKIHCFSLSYCPLYAKLQTSTLDTEPSMAEYYFVGEKLVQNLCEIWTCCVRNTHRRNDSGNYELYIRLGRALLFKVKHQACSHRTKLFKVHGNNNVRKHNTEVSLQLSIKCKINTLFITTNKDLGLKVTKIFYFERCSILVRGSKTYFKMDAFFAKWRRKRIVITIFSLLIFFVLVIVLTKEL